MCLTQKSFFQSTTTSVRLSYKNTYNGTILNPDVAVVEAHDYYPFGLQHHGYHETVNGQPYPYKTYQGQELVKALGLNWLTFKYRSYDPAIGRFLQVDPLAGKYPYNGVYNFSENRVIDGVELEGLEWENFMSGFKDPGELKIKLPNKKTAQRQSYSIIIANSKISFENFKKDFAKAPQDYLSNSKAIFNAPVNGQGKSSVFRRGSYIKINIEGPMNNSYVKVIELNKGKNGGPLSAKFVTLEGHVEKGIIHFQISQKKNGNIKFSINSISNVDYGSVPENFARKQQKESWEEVLNNVYQKLGGRVVKEAVIVDPAKLGAYIGN